MTAVVGSEKSPVGKLKNCDTWAEYESPATSEFANLCNGGSFDGYRWQPCPSRLDCRLATQRKGGNLQVLASNRSGFGRTTLPTKKKEEIAVPGPALVVYPEDAHLHLRTPRLEPQVPYRPSPTFLPDEGENLIARIIKNIFQAMFHALFHQGKEISENVDFFPHRKKEQDRVEE